MRWTAATRCPVRPPKPWTFNITVKRDPTGLVSPWVHENVKPGTVLEMLGPVGAFHLPDADRRARYLLLAAGAGITPIMSMLRTIHSLPGQADVVVLYHGAEAGGFAFHRELAYIASVDSRVKVFYSLGDRSTPEGLGRAHRAAERQQCSTRWPPMPTAARSMPAAPRAT